MKEDEPNGEFPSRYTMCEASAIKSLLESINSIKRRITLNLLMKAVRKVN